MDVIHVEGRSKIREVETRFEADYYRLGAGLPHQAE